MGQGAGPGRRRAAVLLAQTRPRRRATPAPAWPQAWLIVKQASARADVQVLALWAPKHGPAGESAPVHPHPFRHARVRQIVRSTHDLPLAQRQAGWSRLQLAYLTVGDDEARQLMHELTD